MRIIGRLFPDICNLSEYHSTHVCNHLSCISPEKLRVCFEMHTTPGPEYLPISLPKSGRGQPATREARFWKRVGEGDPDLLHLTVAEEEGEIVDRHPDKTHILKRLISGGSCPFPDAGPFDIHPCKITTGVHSGHRQGIVSPATGQLKRQWVVIAKYSAPDRKSTRL